MVTTSWIPVLFLTTLLFLTAKSIGRPYKQGIRTPKDAAFSGALLLLTFAAGYASHV